MVIDHVGWLFFPQLPILNIIGRLSFPLFAFLIAEGGTKTKDIYGYIRRLLLFGVISQLPYSYISYLVGNDYRELNILFTLAGGLFLVALLQKKQYENCALAFIGLSLLSVFVAYDYDVYGLLIILSSYLFIKRRILGVLALAFTTIGYYTLMGSLGKDATIQLFALAGIIPLLFYNSAQGTRRYRWFFYAFYPLHLVILALVFHLL